MQPIPPFKEVINVLVLILTIGTSAVFSCPTDGFYTSLADNKFFPDTNIVPDTAITDTVTTDTAVVKVESVLEAKVEYSADDSMLFDVKAQKVYLYGNAEVNYTSMNIKAAYIEMDMRENILFAKWVADSVGGKAGKPVFEDSGQNFTSETMRYNFKTKKGKITEAITQEGDGYIHGKEIKRIDEEVLYIKDGKYTTCSHPNPHFHIEAKKLKIIRDNKIITGPAYLKIEDVPTILAVPFGFFPNKKGQTSGIVMPTYGESPSQGFFLSKGGYYFGISEYIDLTVLGDIYSRGSWGLDATTNYNLKYKFNGRLNLSYSEFQTSDPEFPDFSKTQNFFVKWKHSQDAKARPHSRFSADVNAGSSNNFRTNLTSSTADYLTNTFSSNISYSKSFAGKPFSIALNGSHSQNTKDSTISITLPQATFTMSRVTVKKILNRPTLGKDKWWEKIGISFTSVAKNQVKTREDSLLSSYTLDKMRNGMKTTIPLSTSFKVLKYFTLNPVVNYSEKWYLETIEKHWNDDSQMLETDTIPGFRRFGESSFSSSLSTKIYGMYTFKSKKLQAVRHVVTPSVGFNYRPDYSKSKFGHYKYVQSDSANTDSVQYSIFQNGIFGSPGKNESGMLTFNLINNLEMKVGTPRDSTQETKKIKIFESLNFSSSYNILADSLKWSTIGINGRTQLAKFLNLRFTGTVDPYAIDDSLGTRINTFQWDVDKRIGRLTAATIAVGINLKSKASPTGDKTSKLGTEEELEAINANPDAYVDFNVPWSLNISYNLSYKKPQFVKTITNSLSFNGDLRLTEKWKIGFSSGYDFETHDLTYTTLDFYRDLHCWELKLNVIPFGDRQSFRLDINVKSQVLQDLKLTRKRDWYDYQ